MFILLYGVGHLSPRKKAKNGGRQLLARSSCYIVGVIRVLAIDGGLLKSLEEGLEYSVLFIGHQV